MRDLLAALSISLIGSIGYAAAGPVDDTVIATALPALAASPDAAAEAIAAGESLPDGPAEGLYDQAFGFLRQADYPAAKRGFETLLKRYPHDPLAANAQYWLAETYSVEGDLEDAAAAFAAAYDKYPGSAKAGESLIKLARTYAALGRRWEACSTYARIAREETAAPALKDMARGDARSLDCGNHAMRRKAGVAER